MAHTIYLALLRGINVGGKNIIKMKDLKACFEDMGFADVTTYIQSGNVICSSSEKNEEKLCKKIERTLSKTFHYTSTVVLIKKQTLKKVIEQAPKDFGTKKGHYRYDVLFVKKPLSAKKIIQEFPLREGVDTATAGTHAIYCTRLIEKASQSRISKIIFFPWYKDITIRNWNTTTKLLALIEK